nr:MAG TPA: zinc-binding protein [Caudoviricetes sp.]
MTCDNEKLIEALGTDEQKKELAERKERLHSWLKDSGIPVLSGEALTNYLTKQVNGEFK